LSKPHSKRNSRPSTSSQSSHTKTTQGAQSNQLRIIGGKWRGRKLQFPSVDGLRPTGDRIRETLFNWLAPFIHGAHCLDLFAGSGALGLEALSRGAGRSVLIERNQLAASSLRQHLQTLEANAEVIQDDALAWLKSANNKITFELVFLDPPFSQALWNESCELLANSDILATGSLIYIETPSNTPLDTIPENWALWREKVAGAVTYRLYKSSP